jgi:lipopolysaccharide/colanic/teichoic acid biosynthesis glycosyltransferase
MKRCLDIAGAFVGLVVLMPLLIAVWIFVVLESGLPGLFSQQRVGRGGCDFVLYKFRTMAVRRGTESGSFDAGSSAHVTRVGRILRKTKLDELPQLWNVLRGDMSLVGPRPEVRKWVEAYPARWSKVLTLRPGITDPASIVYRNEEEILAESADPEATYRAEILPHKLSLYEDYVDTRSFRGDIGILFKTLGVMMKSET